MGYLFLVLTILLESTAVILMKLSNGFQYKAYGIIAIIAYIGAFLFFTYALKLLPAGLANAIWAGSSTILVAVAGIIIFKEQLNGLQIVFLLMIVLGMAGFNYFK